MTFHIITLFPKAFDSYLRESILKRAIENKKIRVKFYNPRDFTEDKHARVDRSPYGGGPGMVIQALPVIKAVEAALSKLKTKSSKLKAKLVWLSPGGKQFTNQYAAKIARGYRNIVIICGRYEGIDARVKKVFKVDEISVGPFVLTGGELPAMIIMDTVSRHVDGVLGKRESLEERRIASEDVYTRPEAIKYKNKIYRVPKVLLSGHHKKIEDWRKKRGGEKT
jgi:tRNA (guanine37-N1)-methyltransferase